MTAFAPGPELSFLIGGLVCRPKIDTSQGHEILRLTLEDADAPEELTETIFQRATDWAIAMGEQNAGLGLRCTRINGVVEIAILPRETFTQELVAQLCQAVTTPLASAAPLPMPEPETAPTRTLPDKKPPVKEDEDGDDLLVGAR